MVRKRLRQDKAYSRRALRNTNEGRSDIERSEVRTALLFVQHEIHDWPTRTVDTNQDPQTGPRAFDSRTERHPGCKPMTTIQRADDRIAVPLRFTRSQSRWHQNVDIEAELE